MIRSEKEFDYIKIKLASPIRILQWSHRKLLNGQFVGEVKSLRRLIIEHLNLKWMVYFVKEFLVQAKV